MKPAGWKLIQSEDGLRELPNKPERIWEHAGVKASNNDWNQIIPRKNRKIVEREENGRRRKDTELEESRRVE